MLFRANYVSTSVSGDYYQAMFAAWKGTENPGIPYLLIQLYFETPDDGACDVNRLPILTPGSDGYSSEWEQFGRRPGSISRAETQPCSSRRGKA
jgi:hypothetical protein